MVPSVWMVSLFFSYHAYQNNLTKKGGRERGPDTHVSICVERGTYHKSCTR